MTRKELIDKARAMTELPAKYAMGGGKLYPKGKDPLDENGKCDCSAFVMWCLGLPKFTDDFAWLTAWNGGWFNTDGIWKSQRHTCGYFYNGPGTPAIGRILVYPAAWVARPVGGPKVGPRVGHVAIVSGPDRIIHCSSGNQRKHGRAIMETDISAIPSPDSIRYLRASSVDYS